VLAALDAATGPPAPLALGALLWADHDSPKRVYAVSLVLSGAEGGGNGSSASAFSATPSYSASSSSSS
jgi:hypothetical protein